MLLAILTQLPLLAVYAFNIYLALGMNLEPRNGSEPARLYAIWGHLVQGALLLAFLAFAFVSCRLIVLLLLPNRGLRKDFAKDLRLHSDIVLSVSPQHYRIHYLFGQISSSGWNVFKRWDKSGDLVLLYYPSNIFVIVNLCGLDEEGKIQFLRMIADVLPERAGAI